MIPLGTYRIQLSYYLRTKISAFWFGDLDLGRLHSRLSSNYANCAPPNLACKSFWLVRYYRKITDSYLHYLQSNWNLDPVLTQLQSRPFQILSCSECSSTEIARLKNMYAAEDLRRSLGRGEAAGENVWSQWRDLSL